MKKAVFYGLSVLFVSSAVMAADDFDAADECNNGSNSSSSTQTTDSSTDNTDNKEKADFLTPSK